MLVVPFSYIHIQILLISLFKAVTYITGRCMPSSKRSMASITRPTSLNVTFLGTASAQPSSTRNHSSLALRLGSDVWLFDCGEATQHQIQKSNVKMGKIEKIFITHTHGEMLEVATMDVCDNFTRRSHLRSNPFAFQLPKRCRGCC